MILVSVGTHSKPFDRLLKHVDELKGKGKIREEVFCQTGSSGYKPKYCKWKKLLEGKEYEEMFQKAKVIVSHCGAGNIINALKNEKPLILVPRKMELLEHTDSHQTDLAKKMQEEGKAIAVFEASGLEEALKKAKNLKKARQKSLEIESRVKEFLEAVAEKSGGKI